MAKKVVSKKQKIIKKVAYKIVNGLLILIVVIFALTALMSKFSIGGIKLFTVQSGSMEPVIKVGAMVLTKIEKSYNVGDIITYTRRDDPTKNITHRIVEKNNTGIDRYTTKGDANSAADVDVVLPTQIVGKVIFNISYVGYPIAFVRTPVGFVLLIIFPATLILYEEVSKIKKEIAIYLANRKIKKQNEKIN
ncbi:MAG: signal peptidase I [Patescibacteria group bacterium]|nr:signal peptidase I [Patescibacteria group bacterium]